MTVDPHAYMQKHMRGVRREAPTVTLAEYLEATPRLMFDHRDQPCPGCEAVLRATAITDLAYVFEVCTCGKADYDHLVVQLWHLKCLQPASFPLSIKRLLRDALYALDRYKAPIARGNAERIRSVLRDSAKPADNKKEA